MNIFRNWKQVLAAVRKDVSNHNDYYLVILDKGTNKERRSKFLTKTEVIDMATKEIQNGK